MSRRPLPMKPWHLYDLIPYLMAKVSKSCAEPVPYTTYGKTARDAMKTFADNHTGDFVLVSGSKEISVTICEGGSWFEQDYNGGNGYRRAVLHSV